MRAQLDWLFAKERVPFIPQDPQTCPTDPNQQGQAHSPGPTEPPHRPAPQTRPTKPTSRAISSYRAHRPAPWTRTRRIPTRKPGFMAKGWLPAYDLSLGSVCDDLAGCLALSKASCTNSHPRTKSIPMAIPMAIPMVFCRLDGVGPVFFFYGFWLTWEGADLRTAARCEKTKGSFNKRGVGDLLCNQTVLRGVGQSCVQASFGLDQFLLDREHSAFSWVA
jgi:hypothetical protein